MTDSEQATQQATQHLPDSPRSPSPAHVEEDKSTDERPKSIDRFDDKFVYKSLKNMRAGLMKEFFVLAFLSRDSFPHVYSEELLRSMVKVKVSYAGEVQWELQTDDRTLVDKLLIWFREPSDVGRPFSACIIDGTTVFLEASTDNVQYILREYFMFF